MRRLAVFLAIAISMLLVACGEEIQGDVSDGSFTAEASEGFFAEESFDSQLLAVAPAATAAPAAAFAAEKARGASGSSAAALETVQRKVVSSASMSIEVEVVEAAIDEVRVIAESLGGFVEHLSSTGGPEHQRASMTVRVPQGQFVPAMERIEALGAVQSLDLGSEDVTEQFIDLEARLKSSLREEESLLSLLGRTATVSEVLAIERELTRIRSDIERVQGQLNFLERRVDLATISVSLFLPQEEFTEAPSAALVIEVSDVDGAVADVKGLVGTLEGVVGGVFLSERDGNEEAELSLRVFSDEFQRTMDFLEGRGKVRSKEVREGTAPSGGDTDRADKPDARIELSLVAEADSNTWLVVAIIAIIGGIWLAVVLGFLLFLIFRAGGLRGKAV